MSAAGPVPGATASSLGELPRALQALRAGLGELPALLREVDAVAAKTKLLGFNAAILAAQAGSEGRSFAIVAEQMKALNQRAEAATKRLHLTVDGLQRAAARATELREAAPRDARDPPAFAHAPRGFDPTGGTSMPTPRPPPPQEVPDVPAPPERPAPEVVEVPAAPEIPELPRTPPGPEVEKLP